MNEVARGSGKWTQPGVPHKGWTCVDIEDLGEPAAVCEMCEAHEIRYVHHMTHAAYPQELGCGCVCAGHMEEDYEGARQREQVLRNATSRKKRWLTRKWKRSAKGNPFINADGYNVVIYPTRRNAVPPSWGFRVENRANGKFIQSRKQYPSEDAAKLRAFDAILWMKQRTRKARGGP